MIRSRRAIRSLARPPSSAAGDSYPVASTASENAKVLHLLLRSSRLRPALDYVLSLQPSSLPDHAHNALLRRLANAGHLRAAVRIFRRIPSPTSFSFNSLLAALLRRGRTRAAAALFDEMLAAGSSRSARPDVCTFNTLIRGLCRNSTVDGAFRLFSEMPRQGCAPDLITYNTLLDGLCRAGKVQIARKLLSEMRTKGSNLAPNVVSYTTLIRGYCVKLLPEDAAQVFDEMLAAGMKPNKITYNTLIQGLCEAQRMDLVKGILKHADGDSKDSNFKPDICTFNTLISAHCKMGRVDDAFKLFERMAELRVKPDSATYSTLMRCLCESGEFGRAEDLIDELLEKEVLKRKGGSICLMAAYNSIFKHFCQNGRTDKARRVLKHLMDKSAKLDFTTFKIIILGHCKEEAFKEGFELLVSMVKRDLVPDAETYQALIEGFLKKEMITFALDALKNMLNSGHRPITSTFHLILAALLKKKGCASQAADLVSLMLDRNIRQNIDLSTEVIISLFDSGLSERALLIVRLIYDDGYSVKLDKVAKCLCEKKKFLEARKILFIGFEKHQNNDNEIISMVVNGLCASGRALEAFQLFYEVVERGSSSDFSDFLSTLKLALDAIGRLEEAQFVSKQIDRANTKSERIC